MSLVWRFVKSSFSAPVSVNASAPETFLETESCTENMSVNFSSNSSIQSCLPSTTLSNRTLTLTLSPDFCMFPSNTASTFCSRPAATASCSNPTYLRTALMGRTLISRMLLSLAIKVSAMPSSNASSRPSASSGLKGSTAIDWIGVAGCGCSRREK